MRLVLLDFRSQVYRALYTRGKPLTSPRGEPTSGTYYFTRILLNVVRDLQPTHFLVAEDSRKSWRRDLYPGYKSGRRSNNGQRDELQMKVFALTIRRCKEVVAALGLPFLEVRGFEADDVIATVKRRFARKGVAVTIVSRDKDLHQLVGRRTRVYDPQDGGWTDARAVAARWGVSPRQVVEVQSLAGDPTDSVPGVRGVGVRTAAKWVREHGTVAAVLENLEALPDRFQQAISETDLELTRKLVTLRRDAPTRRALPTIDSLRVPALNLRRAEPLFKELGFESLLRS